MAFDPSRKTYVLVSSTTYGNWLPGDARGYVDEHDDYGTPFDVPSGALRHSAQESMKESIVLFNCGQAETILECWREKVGELDGALAVVAEFTDKITKSKLLQFFKGRASRVLNKKFGKRTWWTDSGSVRFSFDLAAHRARIEYVKRQANPLVVWINPDYRVE